MKRKILESFNLSNKNLKSIDKKDYRICDDRNTDLRIVSLELWSIFDFLNPDFLGTLKWFRAEYTMPMRVISNRTKDRKI